MWFCMIGGPLFFHLCEKKKIYTPSLSVVRHMLDCFYLVDLVKKTDKYETLIA